MSRKAPNPSIMRSRALRKVMTPAERLLWEHLRRKNIDGLRFRRQYPLGRYFADFVCLPARLIVEVDGGLHALEKQKTHDEARTQWLARENFRVIRFWNFEIDRDLDGVLARIKIAVRSAPPPPNPLPQGEGEFMMSRRTPPASRKGRGS